MIANCSALRPPTEMILYSMERYCPHDSKKYKTISVGGLRAEQFAIKIDIFYRENFRGVEKSRFKIILILFLYIQSKSGFLQTSFQFFPLELHDWAPKYSPPPPYLVAPPFCILATLPSGISISTLGAGSTK